MKALGSEKTERDLLIRIRWDASLEPGEYSVRYLDRLSKKLVTVPYAELSFEGGLMRHGDSMIPMHRVREIARNGEVVWRKRRIK
jgi:uncharacterized protein (UPF0248 family)